MRGFALLLLTLATACPATEEPAPFTPSESDAAFSGSDATSPVEDAGPTDVSIAPDGVDSGQDAAALPEADAGPLSDGSSPDAGCAVVAQRGAWVYRHPGNPWGTDAFVGDAAAEASTIATLQTHQVDRIYGNYGERPITQAATIRAWNAQLEAAGIESQLLLGDAADIFPGCREDLLEEIQHRFIDFNAVAVPSERFDAVHLDIEPQQYKQGAAFPTTTSCGLRIPDWPFWDDTDGAGRARYYERLLRTFEDVRAYLDANGHATTPVYVDLAPWIDSSANFDWSATPDIASGADWLTQAAGEVTGMTFMTYERDTQASIDGAVATEAGLSTELRVSVSAKERAPLSSTITWTDLNAMFAVVEEIETLHCGARPVDLFNYRYLNE